MRAKAIKVMPQPVGAMTDWRGHVSVAITRKHPNARIDIQTVEDGLERGKISLVGVGSIDFTEYRQTVRKGARIIAQRMAEMLQRSQQSNKVRVDHLILAGGGAQYFEDAMREVFAGVDFSVLPKPVAPQQSSRCMAPNASKNWAPKRGNLTQVFDLARNPKTSGPGLTQRSRFPAGATAIPSRCRTT